MAKTRLIPSILFKMMGLAVLVALLSGLPVNAADRDRLKAFLNVTGFDVALDSIALSAADAPEMLGMSASDFGESWTRIAEKVFDTDIMRGMALDILEQTLSDDDLAHAAAFYASPLGMRLVEVENASHMDADDARKQAEGEDLVAAMVASGDERLDVLVQMNAAVDSGDVAVRAVQEIQLRFLLAASTAGVLEQEFDEEMLRAMMKETEGELRLSMRRSALASAAYTYRDINDEDLRAYLAALEDPQMQRVYELMNAVQWEIMGNRYEALAMRMAEISGGQDL
ncbi:hypothetical protein SAMN05443432_105293 [Roseovarius litoreus]|uniref:DUF2059 domain-containing protein n=1 Tax=Roseovarius litoreus TaxID=1155722 RepID=A0A1M7H7Z2_9RHOB|nr:DUF2059 domain-containing protein [Roseovarius litoreus]SHM24518.1 hypothetical protein SAMN05443432_105293 [Roseovarius litoreus]